MDIVNRPYQDNGVIRTRGEVVNPADIKHAQKLREQRYLAAFSGDPLECNNCGRKFANMLAFKEHAHREHPDVKRWRTLLATKKEVN